MNPGTISNSAADQHQRAVEHLICRLAPGLDGLDQTVSRRHVPGLAESAYDRPADDQQDQHPDEADRLGDLDDHEQLGQRPDDEYR